MKENPDELLAKMDISAGQCNLIQQLKGSMWWTTTLIWPVTLWEAWDVMANIKQFVIGLESGMMVLEWEFRVWTQIAFWWSAASKYRCFNGLHYAFWPIVPELVEHARNACDNSTKWYIKGVFATTCEVCLASTCNGQCKADSLYMNVGYQVGNNSKSVQRPPTVINPTKSPYQKFSSESKRVSPIPQWKSLTQISHYDTWSWPAASNFSVLVKTSTWVLWHWVWILIKPDRNKACICMSRSSNTQTMWCSTIRVICPSLACAAPSHMPRPAHHLCTAVCWEVLSMLPSPLQCCHCSPPWPPAQPLFTPHPLAQALCPHALWPLATFPPQNSVANTAKPNATLLLLLTSVSSIHIFTQCTTFSWVLCCPSMLILLYGHVSTSTIRHVLDTSTMNLLLIDVNHQQSSTAALDEQNWYCSVGKAVKMSHVTDISSWSSAINLTLKDSWVSWYSLFPCS